MPLLLFLAAVGFGAYLFNRDSEVKGNAPLDVASEAIKNVVYGVKAKFSTPYDELIETSAAANGLSYDILWNLLYTESRFREDIITGATRSRVGALGIAQFMPPTAVEWLGSADAALDPNKAIPGAARYLAWLIRQTGSVDAGVAAYNWGIGNVKRKGLAAAPQETVDYVASITGTDITA